MVELFTALLSHINFVRRLRLVRKRLSMPVSGGWSALLLIPIRKLRDVVSST